MNETQTAPYPNSGQNPAEYAKDPFGIRPPAAQVDPFAMTSTAAASADVFPTQPAAPNALENADPFASTAQAAPDTIPDIFSAQAAGVEQAAAPVEAEPRTGVIRRALEATRNLPDRAQEVYNRLPAPARQVVGEAGRAALHSLVGEFTSKDGSFSVLKTGFRVGQAVFAPETLVPAAKRMAKDAGIAAQHAAVNSARTQVSDAFRARGY